MKQIISIAGAIALAITASGSPAATEVQFWHSMTGALGDRVVELATKFNASQSIYKVNAVFKGSYDESMAAGIAAFRAGNAPHVIQIFEVGTATMMAARKAIKPVYQLMAEAGEKFDPANYVPAVAGYYTDSQGKMLSFPFNSSTAVFYINKDAFKKAGLNPDAPPKTWREVQGAAEKLKESGATACGFTTGWVSWVQLENMSAWHNVPFATRSNGFDGLDTRLSFNNELMTRHISLLSQWAKLGLFTYAGRRNEAEAKFTNGECGMLTSSSAAYAGVARGAKFQFAVAPLPYYAEFSGVPQNSIIGGASLWVMAGRKADEYKGVAKFFSFLAQPEIQAQWHQQTGYLPITKAAYDLTRQQGFYQKNPGTDISVLQMTGKAPTAASKGVRLGNFVQIRGVIEEELEAVWAQKKAPQDALNSAVERGNELLRRFEKANRT